MKSITKVAVIGAGTMGRQIALNAAIQGFNTKVRCLDRDELRAVEKWENDYLAERIAKGRMSEEQVNEARQRFVPVDSYSDAVMDADLVIEAVPEIEEMKREVLQEINRFASPDAIIATNSSYMVSSAFKDCVDDPGRLCNMHYFNPALVMKLVEIVRGEHTREDTVLSVMDFCDRLGKVPVRVNKEIEGLLANRILRALTDEAMFLVENGYCSFEDLDKACEFGLNHPLGPFKLADMAGIDLRYFAAQKRLKDCGQAPGYSLYKQLYEQGDYGKKTEKGFYDYSQKK